MYVPIRDINLYWRIFWPFDRFPTGFMVWWPLHWRSTLQPMELCWHCKKYEGWRHHMHTSWSDRRCLEASCAESGRGENHCHRIDADTRAWRSVQKRCHEITQKAFGQVQEDNSISRVFHRATSWYVEIVTGRTVLLCLGLFAFY